MSDPTPDGWAVVELLPREARLLLWLVRHRAHEGHRDPSRSNVVTTLSGPAVILFVAWLMAYVLEPASPGLPGTCRSSRGAWPWR